MSILDQMREGFSVMTSDMTRFAFIFLAGAIVLGVVLGSAFVPQIFASTANPYATPTLCQSSYYIFPIFVHGFSNLATAQIQCAITSVNIPVIIVYYITLTGIILLGGYIAIVVLNLSG